MKKILTLLAVAMLPATLAGCAACGPGLSLCPCCPCNCFRREPACPPPPAVCCPPATTYAAPVAATCPPPCAPACPTCPPVASQMMPQYMMPQAMPMAAAAPCSSCQTMAQPYPMHFQQPAYYGESSCGCSAMMMEPGCGFPTSVCYGPFECGTCSSCSGGCSSGCCDAGSVSAPPAAEGFVEPRPGE
jgi:hypothetical protein